MSKIDEARDILDQLGLPARQQNVMSCLTLLALTGLTEDDDWSQSSRPSLTIHQMLESMKNSYGREYAENTRETVRRQVIHQFEQARLVDRNPDQPNLPTNSPRTHYALTTEALDLIRLYGSSAWQAEITVFLDNQGTLLERYQQQREMQEIPVRITTGEELRLSPGSHNELQVSVVMVFAPRFAPGSTLLYMGDTADKFLHLEQDKMKELGIPLTEHDKLPDVVLYDEVRNWLFLVEAVTSHGPVSPKRVEELEILLKECIATRVYVTAFPDFREFKRHADNIAWETEVWVAEVPDHLIHFNGEKLLGSGENAV